MKIKKGRKVRVGNVKSCFIYDNPEYLCGIQGVIISQSKKYKYFRIKVDFPLHKNYQIEKEKNNVLRLFRDEFELI